ncbi:MAG: hypothetical protein FD146_2264 [Anaerolineaceae bacterium]|nr:MAG: hypothetical protein FD146_2264 [Anaerolineaceae bacterium]
MTVGVTDGVGVKVMVGVGVGTKVPVGVGVAEGTTVWVTVGMTMGVAHPVRTQQSTRKKTETFLTELNTVISFL